MQPRTRRAPRARPEGSAGPLTVGGFETKAGEQRKFEIPVARLVAGSWTSFPVCVTRGLEPGACVFISAALHGDEINGVEIIRQVISALDPLAMHGTVIAVPIVNAFGFVNGSRYLPDRRDLNRSFPGSPKGSLAGRLAHQFMTEIVNRCTHGIDLHTASQQRTNLPQLRANARDPETLRIAHAFGAPLLLEADLRDGSLRAAANARGLPMLLYEAGENLRFDRAAIDVGTRGVRQVLAELGVIQPLDGPRQMMRYRAKSSNWVRARRSGILRLAVNLGEEVTAGQILGTIGDVFGDDSLRVRARTGGVIIGHTNNPLVHLGDGLVHIAEPIAAEGAPARDSQAPQ